MVPSWESDLRSGSWHRSPPQVSSCSVTQDQGTDERKGVPINEGEHVESNRQQGGCGVLRGGCRVRNGAGPAGQTVLGGGVCLYMGTARGTRWQGAAKPRSSSWWQPPRNVFVTRRNKYCPGKCAPWPYPSISVQYTANMAKWWDSHPAVRVYKRHRAIPGLLSRRK